MLQPVKISPVFPNKATPTLKFENGADAFSRACLAISISFSESFFILKRKPGLKNIQPAREKIPLVFCFLTFRFSFAASDFVRFFAQFFAHHSAQHIDADVGLSAFGNNYVGVAF